MNEHLRSHCNRAGVFGRGRGNNNTPLLTETQYIHTKVGYATGAVIQCTECIANYGPDNVSMLNYAHAGAFVCCFE